MKSTIITFCLLSLLISSFAQDSNQFGNGPVYDITFSNHGKVIFVAEENSINAYETSSNNLLSNYKDQHKTRILSLYLSKDSSLLASGDKSGLIVIWNTKTKKPLNKLNIHKDAITTIKVSSDNRYLLTGSADNKIIQYDLNNNKVVHEYIYEEDITSLDIHPNGNLAAASCGSGNIEIIDLTQKQKSTTLKEHKDWVRDVAFSNDGKLLYSCGDDGKYIIWRFKSPNNISVIEEQHKALKWYLSLDYTNEQIFATGDMDGELNIHSSHANLYYKINSRIHDIEFLPHKTKIMVGIATGKRGAMIIRDDQMTYK